MRRDCNFSSLAVLQFKLSVHGWPSGTVPDLRPRSRGPPMAAVHQRQLSVSSLRGRLMSTSESCGVNGHTTRYTGPVSVSRGFCWCPADGSDKRERTFTLLYF